MIRWPFLFKRTVGFLLNLLCKDESPDANAGLQSAAVLKPDRDKDTSVIRGPVIRKEGWLNSNGAVKHTAACEYCFSWKNPI